MKQLLIIIGLFGFTNATGFCDKKEAAFAQNVTTQQMRPSAGFLDYTTFFVHARSNDNVSGKETLTTPETGFALTFSKSHIK